MVSRFKGRRALVTGGSRGIGRAIAAGLLQEGAAVLIVGRSPNHLQQAHEVLAPIAPHRIWEYSALIDADPLVHRQIVEFAVQCMGGLDYLVNAAGGAWVARSLEASWSDWRRELDTKFWGYFGMMRAAMPHLQQNPHGGAVVNVVGVAGKDPNPRLPMASVSNAALSALTKIVAADTAGKGVRVVNVNPGASETELLMKMAERYSLLDDSKVEAELDRIRSGNPLGRLPRAEEIADLVLFLLSDQAGMISGTSVDIDGGGRHGLA